MKKIFTYLFLVFCSINAYAQKPLITDSTYKTWTELSNGILSKSGKFAMYTINNKPVGAKTLIVTATDKSWQQEYTKLSNPNFSEDGRYLFAIQNDTLVRLKLGTKEIVNIPHCTGYELYSSIRNHWLFYQLDTLGTLKIKNLNTGRELSYSNIASYIVNRSAESVVLIVKRDSSVKESLYALDLISEQKKEIYKGIPSSDLIFDLSGQKIAFTTIIGDNKQIWYYDNTLLTAKRIADNKSEGIKENHRIATDVIWNFSTDGRDLFFTQASKSREILDPDKPKIWNYQDSYLLPNYESSIIGKSTILKGTNLTVLQIGEKKIKQLLNGVQKIKNGFYEYNNTDVIIIESTAARTDELPWNPYSKLCYYLCNTKTGELTPFRENLTYAIEKIEFSPDGKYILYYDPKLKGYISYNLSNKLEKNISEKANETFHTYYIGDRGATNSGVAGIGIVAWVEDSNRVIVQGTYNLWELDLDGSISPINLTKLNESEGKSIFSLLLSKGSAKFDEIYFVQGFNLKDKSCAIYKIKLGRTKIMSIFRSKIAFDRPYTSGGGFVQITPDGKSFLLRLGQGNNLINYSYTKDFKNIVNISNNHPEKQYNWMKSELINYSDEFGRPCEAILHKPENFDPNKKYPVIFHYYTELSNELHNYISPSLSKFRF